MGQQQELNSCGVCLKYVMFAMNFVFFLVGGALLGVGIWIVLERNYMSVILGTALFTAAAFIILIAGGIIIMISFFGCCGAIRQNKCMLITYFSLVLLIFLILLVAGILAIVFRSQIGEQVRNTMRNTLQKSCGVNLDDPLNRLLTESWDKAQEQLRCCSVEELSWNTFVGSEWYRIQPGQHEVTKPYVPQSCCMKNQYGRYVSLDKCQTWTQGPPGRQSGLQNEALHYRGCYTAGKEFVKQYSAALIGMGIGVALLMIFGLVFSVCLFRQIVD